MSISTMERPNLEDIIKREDVYEKAGRKYCKWSRIAYYLNNHAKGWNFQLQEPWSVVVFLLKLWLLHAGSLKPMRKHRRFAQRDPLRRAST